MKKNYLFEKIIGIMSGKKRGKVLDLGCGDGDYSLRLKELGFEVTAADLDIKRFKHKDKIKFHACDVTQGLPFADNSFDYVLSAELIEHVRNPFFVVKEVNRMLNNGGQLILSTPNILSMNSRIRYLLEGCYEYFREPLIEQAKNHKEVIFNLHLIPWRYHELEYLLADSGFGIDGIFTSKSEGLGWAILVPFMFLQLKGKEARSLRKGGPDYSRINKIILSPKLLFGRHLIIIAEK